MVGGLFRCEAGCQMGVNNRCEGTEDKKWRGGREGWMDNRDENVPHLFSFNHSALYLSYYIGFT